MSGRPRLSNAVANWTTGRRRAPFMVGYSWCVRRERAGVAVVDTSSQSVPVRVKAAVVDPGEMRVLWMNEAAEESLLDRETGFTPGMSAEALVPMTGTEELPETLARVAATGDPQHLRVDLVSTGRGSVTISTSAYPLPDGMLLVLVDNVWLAKHETESASRRPNRRRR